MHTKIEIYFHPLVAHNLQVQQEFGSFSNYCWRFMNNKQLRNAFRYARQVPVKTPKAELISKDLMQRGFRCVGPTVVYSFMQVAGIVNDHLVTCFRYQECNSNVKKNFNPEIEETKIVTEALEKTCLSQWPSRRNYNFLLTNHTIMTVAISGQIFSSNDLGFPSVCFSSIIYSSTCVSLT